MGTRVRCQEARAGVLANYGNFRMFITHMIFLFCSKASETLEACPRPADPHPNLEDSAFQPEMAQ